MLGKSPGGTLPDLLTRALPPEPWAEGDNIPWDDPDFSRRMLREHLSQDHDLASRRDSLIEAHVRSIHEEMGTRHGARILDLGCGPGLYVHRLARLGHRCHGIDFSPASIEHARDVATREQLDCTFEQADLRTAGYGENWDLVLLIFGQINVFERERARQILQRAHAALRPGGKLLLEPQEPEAIRGGTTPEGTTDWQALPSGLFASKPHLLLHERFWDESTRTATDRWHVVGIDDAPVQRCAMSTCSYTADELCSLLKTVGFRELAVRASLTDEPETTAPGLFALVATR